MARKRAGVFFQHVDSLRDAPVVIWEARLRLLQHSHYVRGELFVFK